MTPTTIDDLRTAHIEGPTFCQYTDDNKSIVTGGSDGDLRLYPGFYDDESESASVGSKVTCLTLLENLIVIANDVFEVKSYCLPSLVLENVLLRFTALVNHVYIRNDKTLVGAASSDFMVKIVNIDGSSQRTFIGHEAPVLCLYIGHDTMVSSSCDGTLRVWNLSDQICSRTLNIIPKSNTVPENGCHFSMSDRKENIFAIPCDKSVKFICGDTWSEQKTLTEEHQAAVSVVKWSPCGKYLATATANGEIFGWDANTGKCLAKFQHCGSKAVTSLTWNKSNKGKILFSSVEGDYGCCELPLGQEEISKPEDCDALLDDIDMGDDINMDEIDMDGNIDDGDEDILKSTSSKKKKKRVVALDEEEEDNDDDVMPTLSKKRKVKDASDLLDQHAAVDNGIDDEEDDVYADKGDILDAESDIFDGETDVYDLDNEDNFDDNNTTLNLIKEGLIAESKPPVIEDEDSIDSVIKKTAKEEPRRIEMPLQEPFQPSSTPSTLMHSFMLWNSVGIIRCHIEDDVSFIDVEFHDSSTHHALHIPNPLNYSMAAMSETAIVFACEDDENIPSKMACTHFGSWDSNKEWDVSMPAEESIECIAVNNTHVAVATNERLLRLFSISGTQIQLFALPGPVVSMAMHEKQIMLIYHKSGGFHKCHCFGILQYRLHKNFWKVFSDTSYTSKLETTLTWIGFSPEGTPVMSMSSGDVLLYHRHQNSWIPVANTKQHAKHKSDTYWIVGIEESQKQIRCIYCKGSKFPGTLPRPIPVVIPFQMPLCEITTEKTIKEEELMKCKLISSNMKYNTDTLHSKIEVELQDVERQQIRLLMQLFALACKSDQESRAVEVCNLMPNAESIGMAIQYASKIRRMGLAQRLTEIARRRASAEEEDDDDDEEEDDMGSEDEVVEEDGYGDSEDESTTADNSMNSIQSSGPRMAVLGKRSNPFRQKVETNEREDDSECSPLSPEHFSKETSKVAGTVKNPSVSQSNPFKTTTSKPASDALSRGTGYFEKLPTQNLSKKSKEKGIEISSSKSEKQSVSEKVTKKKKTATITFSTNRKKTTELQKEEARGGLDLMKKNEESVVEKKTKISGFQLYLENIKEVEGTNNDENIVPKVMQQWKELSQGDKTKWIEKATMQNEGTINDNVLTSKVENKQETKENKQEVKDDKLNNKNICDSNKSQVVRKLKNSNPDEKLPDAKKISEVKNTSRQKLAAFSFQQK